MTNKKNYWDSFYSSKPKKLNKHSMFAEFCNPLLVRDKIDRLIDFGCGNGRDSYFFLDQGLKVLSIDSSANAIIETTKKCSNFSEHKTLVMDVTKKKFNLELFNDDNFAFYARFFIHTLSDDEIKNFFKNCFHCMNNKTKLYIEYRTKKDLNRKKETTPHFRNYIDPIKIKEIASDNKMKCIYENEGTGMAIWLNDDAYVSRQIFKKL